MDLLVAAAALVAFAGLQWLATGPRLGDVNKAALTVVFGARAVRRSRWFATDERGVYVAQRALAWIYLGAAAVCAWIGLLTLVIG